MRHINAADLCRQIRREGRRLGLVPHVDDEGVVSVAQMETRYGGRGIVSTCKEPTPICNVDMDHPISTVGKYRKRRWDRSRLARLRAATQRRKDAERKRLDDMWHAYRGDLEKARRQLGAETFAQAVTEVFGVRSDRR